MKAMTYPVLSAERLENPERVEELNPKETLERAGLKKGDIFCDIGTWFGLFTLEAAKITENTVYALELYDEYIDMVQKKCDQEGLTNVKLLKVTTDVFPVPSQSCDFILLSTVLREILDKDTLLKEMRRMLRNAESRLVIIELHKKKTPIGPGVEARMSEEEVREFAENEGFVTESSVVLGENYYCVTFLRS